MNTNINENNTHVTTSACLESASGIDCAAMMQALAGGYAKYVKGVKEYIATHSFELEGVIVVYLDEAEIKSKDLRFWPVYGFKEEIGICSKETDRRGLPLYYDSYERKEFNSSLHSMITHFKHISPLGPRLPFQSAANDLNGGEKNRL